MLRKWHAKKAKENHYSGGAIGNTLEWYDFTIYAFFVPIIAKQFFPNQDPIVSILATFAVFAIGFLVRPLGAILFGYVGDHIGRKKALVLSMLMMSFPTFLIGLLPDYFSIGIWEPVLLIGLRMIQGLAVSGELTTATVFLIEHAEKQHRGFAGSLAMAGALLGMVLSAIFATVMTQFMGENELANSGWRIPFLLGGLLGVVGLMVRLGTIEPAEYEQMKAHKKQIAQSVSIKQHIGSLSIQTLMRGIFLTSIMAIANYFLIALIAGSLSGVVPTLLTEIFATHHRNMGISLTYNISLALFGGTAPLVAISLVNFTQNLCSPAWYVIGCGCIALFALQRIFPLYVTPQTRFLLN